MSFLVVAWVLAFAPEEPARPAPVARLTRTADPVALLDGEAESERHLFYNAKSIDMRAGDGIRQGAHGASRVYFSDDFTVLSHFGETHCRLVDGGRVLEYERFRRIQAQVGEKPVELRLAPGLTLRLLGDGSVRVELDERDHRVRVRNAGPSEVLVQGDIRPPGVASVAPGGEAWLPLLHDPSAHDAVEAMPQVTTWRGRAVRAADGVSVESSGHGLELSGDGLAVVGGARIRVAPSHKIRIWRPSRRDG